MLLDDLDQYKNWFDTAHCHFLITSRSQPSEWAIVEVDSLPEDDAVRLFRKLHPSVSADDEAIKNGLSKLFYHTLLIELVAKAGATTGIPFADLQRMIETQFIHHQSLNEAPIPTGKHGSVVATNLKKSKIEDYIWLIFSQVKGLDEGSKHLLKAMALLPVATPFDVDFLKAHFAFFNISDAVVQLDTLIEQGWLQKEQAEGQKPYFKMHPLIGDVVVEHLGLNATFAEAYIKIIAIGINYDSTNSQHNLFVINKKKLFAERLSNLFFHENSEGLEELLGYLGYIEENFGFYNKAAYYKERALQIVETVYEKNHPMISVRQNNLGWTYHYLGKYNQAIELLETALANDIKTFGKDHPLVARVQSNLAIVYDHLGRYNEAADLLEIVLENNLRIFGKDHPSIARTLSNLAIIYDHLGRYNEAADLLEIALASDLKNFDKNHPTIARVQSNLANVYLKFGINNEAADLLETALASNLKNFGKDHPEVTINQSNLAMVYKDLEKYDKAAELMEIVLANDLKNLGKDHPDVAVSQNNLAILYKNVDRDIEAKALWQAAYKNQLNNLGETHLRTIYLKQMIEM